MKSKNIVFKKNRNCLKIILPIENDFDELKKMCLQVIIIFKKNFQCDKILIISFENRILNDKQENELLRLMKKELYSNIKLFKKNDDNAQENNSKVLENISKTFKLKDAFYVNKSSLRSGQSIFNDGNVIILGSVNSGAEISATENIIIMGKVTGLLHAGCSGNKNSFIVALEYKSVQVRIANCFFRLGQNIDKPVIISIKNNSITIDFLTT
jgi:septum site-determining protein MinC